MATGRSFAEFVKDKCYNGLYQTAEEYVKANWESMDLYARKVHRVGYAELVDATIERVYVRDLPGMRVAFEAGLQLEIEVKEGDYHYDESDMCYPWIRIYCQGDLSCGLDDWEIIKVEPYSKNKAPANSLSDALVPYIPYDRLDQEANAFLKDYYPDALKITPYGQPPVAVDPLALAESLKLKIMQQRIREDASVFGQIYFVETEAEMFDANEGKTVTMTIPGKTIVFDPQMYLLRNLGSVNNTIIHECVHWVKHRKVFELEKLYNAEVSNISCEVVGGAASAVARSATEQMEKQANQLTPRIQMPAEPFKVKAREIRKHDSTIYAVLLTNYELDDFADQFGDYDYELQKSEITSRYKDVAEKIKRACGLRKENLMYRAVEIKQQQDTETIRLLQEISSKLDEKK